MIKVMVVDDSPTICQFLKGLIDSDPELSVVVTANNGESAVKAQSDFDPDVITMDLQMPKMDGFEAITKIMARRPKPIIVVTSIFQQSGAGRIFKALELGAVVVLNVPYGIGHPKHKESADELIGTIKRVVNRQFKPFVPTSAKTEKGPLTFPALPIRVVALGASTGGPMALRTILQELPADFSAPLLIAQHMSPGFMLGFIEWLGSTCKLPIHLAEEGQLPIPGHIYSAPESQDIALKANGLLTLHPYAPNEYSRPSISYLFSSVAKAHGKFAIGILLTGMGRDGVEGLSQLSSSGAMTIAQDRESSIVFGMPGEAITAGAADYILSPEAISSLLIALSSGGFRHG